MNYEKQFSQKSTSNANFNELRILAFISFICLWLALEKRVLNLVWKNMATGKASFSQNSHRIFEIGFFEKNNSRENYKKVFKIVSQKIIPLK